MEFQEVVRRRRMVRKFTDEPVAEESLQRIMRNAQRGPSAGFSQGQAFLVLQGAELKRFTELGELWAGDGVGTAPVMIIPFAVKDAYLDRYALPDKGVTDRDESWWTAPFWHIDTGMAVLLILQTAVDEGLGAAYFGLGRDVAEKLHDEFGVPEDHEPIGVIALGHGDEPTATPGSSVWKIPRRSFGDVVHFGRW